MVKQKHTITELNWHYHHHHHNHDCFWFVVKQKHTISELNWHYHHHHHNHHSGKLQRHKKLNLIPLQVIVTRYLTEARLSLSFNSFGSIRSQCWVAFLALETKLTVSDSLSFWARPPCSRCITWRSDKCWRKDHWVGSDYAWDRHWFIANHSLATYWRVCSKKGVVGLDWWGWWLPPIFT